MPESMVSQSAVDLPMAEAFLRHLVVERRLADHTVVAYRTDLQRFARFWHNRHAGPLSLEQLACLGQADFRAFLAEEFRAGMSKATLQRRLAALRAWMGYLEREGVVVRNASRQVATPRLEKRLPRAPSEEQTSHMMVSHKPLLRSRPAWLDLRDTAILELLYSSGLRVAELCDLDRLDLDDQTGEVRVMGKGDKERIVPVGRMALTAIRDYLQSLDKARPGLDARGPLFLGARGERVNPREAQRLVAAIRRGLGLPADVTPHALRHAFATHLLQAGADMRAIQEMMGHASLSVTQKYTHLDLAHLARVYDSSHPRARKAQT